MTTATTAEVRRGNKERKRVRLDCDIPFVVHRLGFPVDLRIRSFGERRPLQRQRAEAKLDRGKAAEVVLTRYSGATGEGTTVIRNMRYFAATCSLPEKRAPIAQGGRDARKAYVPGGHSRRDRECRNCPLRSGPRRPAAGKTMTFVRLHGGWHGGWCWSRVAEPLPAAGHRVYTPTQTGLGERSHLISKNITLTSSCRTWSNVFEWEDLNDVILVGHSFGGIASTGAADRIPKRLSAFGRIGGLREVNGFLVFRSTAERSTQ